MSHVIDFNPDGTAEAMHCDAFSLAFLGPQRIERASEIKFNEAQQSWEIMLPNPKGNDWVEIPHGSGFQSYEHARAIEVEWLNYCRFHGLDPQSKNGGYVLYALRYGNLAV